MEKCSEECRCEPCECVEEGQCDPSKKSSNKSSESHCGSSGSHCEIPLRVCKVRTNAIIPSGI